MKASRIKLVENESKQGRSDEERPFILNLEAIRERAKAQILDGAVVSESKASTEQIVKILNEALATEIVCMLRYMSHYYLAEGIHSESVKAEFLEHAEEERKHGEKIAERIKQLNGKPDFNPEGLLMRSHSEYKNGDTLVDLIQEDLIAERIAIETYKAIIDFVGDSDPTTRRLLEKVLEQEEEHADELADLLKTMDPRKQSA